MAHSREEILEQVKGDRRLHEVLAGRPHTRRVEPVPGDVEQTYRTLLDRL